MSKFSEQFRLQVVKQYLAGNAGYLTVARNNGTRDSFVKKWVAAYRQHGVAGLSKKFQHYDASFRLQVLRHMWDNDLSYAQTAAFFDIRSQGCPAVWERCYHEGGIEALIPRQRGKPKRMPDSQTPPSPSPADDQNLTREQLLAEITQLRMENAYLKKLDALIQSQQQDRIGALFARHHGRYGYRRITAALGRSGQPINHKTVQRLMHQMGLRSLVRPKKYRSYRGDVGRAAPNLLQRQFFARQANEKWVTDVTEFNVGGEKLYLSPVMDFYNGEIIAFETARRPQYELIGSMLKKALAKLKAGDAPLLHSDQGWQYRMPAYQQALQRKGVEQSMSRKGNCLDNAAMESFFAVLKSELFYLNKFTSVDDLQAAIKKYIRYYNHDRIKMKLKGLSPVQYRTQPLAT